VVELKVAALFVEVGGSYYDVPGVEPWDEWRDARRYDGKHPVLLTHRASAGHRSAPRHLRAGVGNTIGQVMTVGALHPRSWLSGGAAGCLSTRRRARLLSTSGSWHQPDLVGSESVNENGSVRSGKAPTGIGRTNPLGSCITGSARRSSCGGLGPLVHIR
jgi:hypothetical protein